MSASGPLVYCTYRIAENTTEIHRLRPPRRFHKDHIMRPYNSQEAEGCAILMVNTTMVNNKLHRLFLDHDIIFSF